VKEDPDGRSRGYGFVNFEDPALVEQVMAQQDHVIDGRKVSPRPILQVAILERSCKCIFDSWANCYCGPHVVDWKDD
jgi:RNA recognition motif-containing protein